MVEPEYQPSPEMLAVFCDPDVQDGGKTIDLIDRRHYVEANHALSLRNGPSMPQEISVSHEILSQDINTN